MPTRVTTPHTWSGAYPADPACIAEARRFLAAVMGGCPAASDAVLCISELATNSVLHSASRQPGGTFTVYAEMHPDYAWIEVRDNGGPWKEPGHRDDRPHGLGIVRELAADWGIDGDALTGWIVWARLEWP